MISTQRIGSVSVIKVQSSLQNDCVAECKDALSQAIENGCPHIVVNLSGCPLLSSDGLEFIVEAQEECLSRGGRLVVAEPQSLCGEILTITGLDQRVSIYRDMRTALTDFAR